MSVTGNLCALFGIKSGLGVSHAPRLSGGGKGQAFIPGGGRPSPAWAHPVAGRCVCPAQHLCGPRRGWLAGWRLICHGSFPRGHYLELHFFRDSQVPREFHFCSSLCFHTRLTFHPPSSVLPLSHFTLLSLNNVCIFY